MEREEPHEPTAPPLQNASKARTIKKLGQEAKRQALYRMSGVDITQIDAIGVETVEVVVSEYGSDLSRFPHGEAVRLPRHLGAECAQKRRQARKEEKAEQRKYARRGCFAYGGALSAPQPNGPRSILSKNRTTTGRRHCRLRRR